MENRKTINFKVEDVRLLPDFLLVRIDDEVKSENGLLDLRVTEDTLLQVVAAGSRAVTELPGIVNSWVLLDNANLKIQMIDGVKYKYVPMYSIYSYVVGKGENEEDN